MGLAQMTLVDLLPQEDSLEAAGRIAPPPPPQDSPKLEKVPQGSLLPSPPSPSPPLNSECFVVSSRGWELDQGKLLRSLDRISCANFSRVQGTNHSSLSSLSLSHVYSSVKPSHKTIDFCIKDQHCQIKYRQFHVLCNLCCGYFVLIFP